jgi:hypothetical protein
MLESLLLCTIAEYGERCVNKQTVTDMKIAGKRVLIRADLNVPLESGKVKDTRILAALPAVAVLQSRTTWVAPKMKWMNHWQRSGPTNRGRVFTNLRGITNSQ